MFYVLNSCYKSKCHSTVTVNAVTTDQANTRCLMSSVPVDQVLGYCVGTNCSLSAGQVGLCQFVTTDQNTGSDIEAIVPAVIDHVVGS